MDRSEARAMGLKRYDNGHPCPNGHLAGRYVSTGGCCACLLTNATDWKDKNRNRTREYARTRYWKDPAAHNAKTQAWFAENPIRAKELRDAWHAANPLGRRLHEGVRRARKKGAGGSFTQEQVNALATKQRHRCVYCGRSIRGAFHIDHRKPIALNGRNDISNIQLLCQSCNQRKHAKDPVTFARQIGQLL